MSPCEYVLIPNKAVSLGNSPTSTILALRPESKERLNSRRSVMFSRSSLSHGTRRANRSTPFTSACITRTQTLRTMTSQFSGK